MVRNEARSHVTPFILVPTHAWQVPCAPRDPGLRERSPRLTPKGPRPQHGVAAGRGSLGGRWAGPRKATSLKDTAAPPTLPSVHCIRGGSQRPSRVFGGLSPSQAPPGPQGSSPLGTSQGLTYSQGPSPLSLTCASLLSEAVGGWDVCPAWHPVQASSAGLQPVVSHSQGGGGWTPKPTPAGPVCTSGREVHLGRDIWKPPHVDRHTRGCLQGREETGTEPAPWMCGGGTLSEVGPLS